MRNKTFTQDTAVSVLSETKWTRGYSCIFFERKEQDFEDCCLQIMGFTPWPKQRPQLGSRSYKMVKRHLRVVAILACLQEVKVEVL